ncbi:MAG: alanyl-tRNA editing protein [Chloroflexota bacterium]
MTKKLFWVNPYQNSCETEIESVSGSIVTLKETIFYAFSGGQESDHGTIGGYQVINARKIGLDIEYEMPGDHALLNRENVNVSIDWSRRYALMRLHFAAELVLELTYQQLPGIEKIGAHIAQDKARIDYFWPQSISPYLAKLASDAQKIIDENHEIRSAFSDELSQRRYWEIPGFAKVPCGGTHLRKTGEVGLISLKRNNIGKGKERIEVFVNLLNPPDPFENIDE